tara:strand:+ start:2291 stop:2827 length:537 start_codon:yes stop_codon:yes gene_type:complete
MPIAAIPQGVEIKKLTPTQEKALDKLLRQQRDENTLQTAIRVAIPTVAFVGVAGAAIATTFAYLKDIELPTVKDIVTSGGDLVSDVIVSGVDTIVGKQQPATPEYIVTDAGTTIGPLSLCERWETDYVNVAEQIAQGEADSRTGTVVAALLQKNIIKQMKKNGCERPVFIPATQWDEV